MNLENVRNLSIETSAFCNRTCSGCLRNSHPAIPDGHWDNPPILPLSVVFKILDEAVENEFKGKVCLSHYNEPLMEDGFPMVVRGVKKKYPDLFFYAHTNGDFLTEDIANQMDGYLDRIVVSLYMDEPKKSERAQWVHSLFSKTICDVILQSTHIPTHFSPDYDIKSLIEQNIDHDCKEPSMRIIINHESKYLFCCDDLLDEFHLGSYPEKSLVEHWNEKMKMQAILLQKGGRRKFSYCSLCPRP